MDNTLLVVEAEGVICIALGVFLTLAPESEKD